MIFVVMVVVLQVISTLKKITLQENDVEEAEEEDTTSLDRPHHRAMGSPRHPRSAPPLQTQWHTDEDHLPPAVSVDPSMLCPNHTTTSNGPSDE